jgi:hypothetical protein
MLHYKEKRSQHLQNHLLLYSAYLTPFSFVKNPCNALQVKEIAMVALIRAATNEPQKPKLLVDHVAATNQSHVTNNAAAIKISSKLSAFRLMVTAPLVAGLFLHEALDSSPQQADCQDGHKQADDQGCGCAESRSAGGSDKSSQCEQQDYAYENLDYGFDHAVH